ncbi:MAG: CynX/NimT family MFS transporter [Vulcanimicrobiaceae bacterium]
MRITILAVPPVLPLIHRTLSMNEAAVGALTGLPLLLLGIAAVGGSLLIARIGARGAWIAGLLLVAAGSAARGAGPSEAMLFAMTFVMGLGVAVCQPAAPTTVGEWFPRSIGFATAIYVNGLLVGETLSAAFTIPYVLPWLRDNWELSLVFWSLPVWLAVVLFAMLGRNEAPRGTVRWWPDWRDGFMWRFGIILAGASVTYWSANAFIPDYLREFGRADAIEPSLTILNAAQLPGSLLTLFVADRLAGRRDVFVAIGIVAFASILAFIVASGWIALLAIGFLGAATSFTMVMVLALPPMVTEQHNVHRLSAGILTISYCVTFLGNLAGGALWDATHLALASFVPAIAGTLALTLLSIGIRLKVVTGMTRVVKQQSEGG